MPISHTVTHPHKQTYLPSLNVTMVVVSNTLPRLGLGLAALGRPGYINLERSTIFDSEGYDGQDSQRRSVERMQNQANIVMATMMEEAKKNDMLPWFDCARSYGLSEKFVGDFLRSNGVKADEVFCSSKWGYTYVADWNINLGESEPHEVKDHSVENFLKQVEETKENIGEYLDLYQVHSATFESGILSDKRVHEALSSYKKENGWSIGLSVSGPSQDDILREAMKITTSDGTKLFDSVQCTFNILEQRPGEALLEAHNAGMDIIIKEGMANGRTLKNDTLQEFTKSSGHSADQLALACILAQPFQPRVLSGAVTNDQLKSNAVALELSKKMQDEEKDLLDGIMKGCKMESEQYWKDRSALQWN